MRISKHYLLLLFLCLWQAANAQSHIPKLTFPLDENQSLRDLAKVGLDLTHGSHTRNTYSTVIEEYQLARLDSLGIRYEIDVPDMNIYRKLSAHENRNGFDCQENYINTEVPANFEFGQIGGFYSLPEVLDQLDAMALTYPNLISIRRPVSNFKTYENNSIFWVRISDNPENDEAEPEVLYTGLHHAREFISVSQMIYFMWYLLENYDKNPMVQQIINSTELYFVPVLNPDGMNYNVEGYDKDKDAFSRILRKNMRDNDLNGIFDPKNDGVDLNRNYATAWGVDNEGSSSFPGSDTYRGPTPFSEPETKAIQYLFNNHDFKVAINHHSYGNFLIYPWGFTGVHTTDSITFMSYGTLLTEHNHFISGLTLETVGYLSNGEADDWMFDEHGTYAMTAEVGREEDWFYPSKNRIIPLCQSTLHMNLQAARLVNSLIEITDETPPFVAPGINPLVLEFNRYGLLDGQVDISFNAVSGNVLNVPAPFSMDLQKFETHTRELSFSVDPNIHNGEKIKLEVVIKQGAYVFRDTITKIRADVNTPIYDKGELTNWDRSSGLKWNVTTESFKSAPVSVTDSPFGNYDINANEVIVLNETVDLRDVTSAYAQFWARWDIEDQFDYVAFQASRDGQNWENICGQYSTPGSLFQMYEQPIYDDDQHQWVLEKADLESYIGDMIQLRFNLVTEGFNTKDGFYFDDFKIITVNQESVATQEVDPSLFSVMPNPATEKVRITVPSLPSPSIIIYDPLGQRMHSAVLESSLTHDVKTNAWPAGLYRYVVYSQGRAVHSGAISIMP